MNQFLAPLVAVILLSVSACSQTPRVSIKEYEDQDVGLVAKHWRDLANVTVEKYVQNKMGKLDKASRLDSVSRKAPPTNPQVNTGPVYIQKGLSDSAFDRAFHNYLTSAFLQKGVKVSKQATNATVFNYSAETFLYSRVNNEKSPFSYASFLAIANKIRDDIQVLDSTTAADRFLIYGLVWDFLAAKNKVTDAEVVLTISVEEANFVKYKDSTEFYIERNDLPLYWSDKPMAPVRLDGGQSDRALKAVSIPVRGK